MLAHLGTMLAHLGPHLRARLAHLGAICWPILHILRKIFLVGFFIELNQLYAIRWPCFSANFHGFQGIVGQVHQLYAPRCGKTHILGGCWAAFSNRWRRFAADFCSFLFSAMVSRGPTSENSDKLHLQAKATQLRCLSQRFVLLLQVVQLACQNLQ